MRWYNREVPIELTRERPGYSVTLKVQMVAQPQKDDC